MRVRVSVYGRAYVRVNIIINSSKKNCIRSILKIFDFRRVWGKKSIEPKSNYIVNIAVFFFKKILCVQKKERKKIELTFFFAENQKITTHRLDVKCNYTFYKITEHFIL